MKRKEYRVKDVSSIREMMMNAVTEAAQKTAYRYKSGKNTVNVSFAEFYGTVEALGASLCELGLGSSHIACIGENRYEWIVAFLTVLQGAGVFVPIDRELLPKDKNHLINDSESKVVFFSGKYGDYIKENASELEGVSLFVGFDLECDESDRVKSYKKLVEAGRYLSKAKYDRTFSDKNDMKLLVYTSGTTGVAKGVMLTEHNLVSVICNGLRISKIYDVGLSVLPYHHTYEAVCDILVSIHQKATLCICQSVKEVVRDMKFYKPSYIFLVPAFTDFIYTNIMRTLKKEGKLEKFEKAVEISDKLLKVGIDMRKTLFGDILKNFGGRLKQIGCGGAPVHPHVAAFFKSIGITVINGYGITECSPLVSATDETDRDFKTAGNKIPCLEWRISHPNEEGIGEICVKGDSVMKGYYKNPEKTAEVLCDGWFHTGDYGFITDDERLVITGRKKNIIVLSNGKNVYPEEIEQYVLKVDCVEEAVVKAILNGRGEEVGLAAEVYLNEEAGEDEILKAVKEEQKGLPTYKIISKIIIRNEPFPKTTTNKIIR